MYKYLLAILLASTLGLGVSTYQLIGKLANTEAQVELWQQKANQNAEAVTRAVESCEISLKAIEDTQKAIDALNESRTSDLDALAAIPQITLPETHVNGSHPTTAASKTADDLRLSPDLMRLLDNAYCSGAKGDSYCTTR